MNLRLSFIILTALAGLAAAQTTKPEKVSTSALLRNDDAWFKSDDAKRLLANTLTFQNEDGGWPKNYNVANARPLPLPKGKLDEEKFGGWNAISTIDNNATWTEIRLVARAYSITHDARFKDAALRGIEFLVKNQYDNGGWAQRFPPPKDNYGHQITYNDNAMAAVIQLLRDVAEGRDYFEFVPQPARAAAGKSYERGIECILNTQIKVNGKLTAWCQQHDSVTLAPVKARAFEPAALCTSESAGILSTLMQIDKPGPRVKQAIEAGAAWFESVKISGKRIETFTNAKGQPDRRLVDDSGAAPIWSRLYDLKTMHPIFGDVDGSVHESWDDISHERRNGYAWYRDFGSKVERMYADWKKKNESLPAR